MVKNPGEVKKFESMISSDNSLQFTENNIGTGFRLADEDEFTYNSSKKKNWRVC